MAIRWSISRVEKFHQSSLVPVSAARYVPVKRVGRLNGARRENKFAIRSWMLKIQSATDR